MDKVSANEQELARLTIERLSQIEGVTIYGPATTCGCRPIYVGDIHPRPGDILDGRVCIRAGHHCTQRDASLGVAATACIVLHLQ